MDDGEQNSVPGSCPEFGAIFMSNNATKKECLRRKVFALPSSQSHFVKQVKAGMILFLFEFERRELHGVFQASSDGAMNILPHAFSSSGKQFPAQNFVQVRFTPMCYCSPLSENEFHDAVRENYFSRYKFNFGLSKDQVQRLLSLFSLKRLKDQAPQRQLTRSRVARPSEYSTSKNRRLVDRSPMSNQVPGDFDVDKNHRPVISTMHQGDSLYDDDRATDDGQVGTYTDVGYEHKASAFLNECFRDLMGQVGGNIDAGEYATNDSVDIQWNTDLEFQPAVSDRDSSGNFRSISNDVRFAKSDRVETKCYKDGGFAPTISTGYPSSFQSKVNPQVYSRKHVLETGSFIEDPTRPSSMFLPSMEMQNSNVGYPMTLEDSIVTAALPYDPNVPNSNYRGSFLGFNQDHAPLQEYASHDSFVGNVLGSSTNQSFPSLSETRRTTITPDVNSDSRDFIPLPLSNQTESSNRTSLQRYYYLDNLASNYSKKEHCGDLSLLKPSLAPVPSSELGNNVRISEPSSSYRTSPSKFSSFTFPDRYPTLLQDKHDSQLPEYENGGFMLKEGQHHEDSFYNDNRAIEDSRFVMYGSVEYENKESQQQLHVHEPTKVDYHEVISLSPAACLHPDRRKKRSSVFSRLSLPSNTPPGTADIDRNTSVNEVMDMLHQSSFHWVKTSKQSVRHHDNAFREEKQATRKLGLAMITKEMNVKPILFSEENSSQKTEEITFVDFKRRSAVRKNLEDGKNGNHYESLINKSASASQCKKRKLIRPDFCENESSNRYISGDAAENIIASSTECSVGRNAQSIKVSVCHVNENNVLQNVKLPNVICQAAVEVNNIDKASGLNSEQFSTEGFIALRSADEGGKEISQSHGISSMTSVSSGDMCIEVEQDLAARGIQMHGLSQDLNDASHSTRQSSPKICEDNSGNGVLKSKFFHNIDKIKDLCPVVGETPPAM